MRGSVYFSRFKAACSRGWANDAGSSSHRASTSASFRSSARAPCTRSFRCGPGRRRQFPACPEGVLLPDGRKPPHAGDCFSGSARCHAAGQRSVCPRDPCLYPEGKSCPPPAAYAAGLPAAGACTGCGHSR